MTVISLKESQERIRDSAIQRSKEFRSSEFEMAAGNRAGITDGDKAKICVEVETDGDCSGGFSDDMELETKVRRWMKKIGLVHSQILRLREEDSHLGEDIGEGLSARERISGAVGIYPSSHMDVLLFPRLPSSPLGGKTCISTSSH